MAAREIRDQWGAFVDRSGVAALHEGLLSGLSVAVKDNIAVGGLAWTAGLPLLGERVAERDASSVATLRMAGAVIAGTVATDAAGFGMMTPGVVNPLDASRTTGGSSGGSAAAVAGGLADAALGTDTAGSVRVPAACCGLLGLKPTFGRIALDGVTPLSVTFDHVGILAGDLDVMRRVAAVLLPAAAARAARMPKRIGFDAVRVAGCHGALRVGLERTLAWLAAEGHEIVEIELPDPGALADTHGAIVCAEAFEQWRGFAPFDEGRFGETAGRALKYASTLPPDEVSAAREELFAVRASIDAVFASVDTIVGPTIAVAVPAVGARRVAYRGIEVPVVFGLLAETCPFNVSGHPALSVPLPWLDQRIPLSIQIACGRDGEWDGFALADRLKEMASSARVAAERRSAACRIPADRISSTVVDTP